VVSQRNWIFGGRDSSCEVLRRLLSAINLKTTPALLPGNVNLDRDGVAFAVFGSIMAAALPMDSATVRRTQLKLDSCFDLKLRTCPAGAIFARRSSLSNRINGTRTNRELYTIHATQDYERVWCQKRELNNVEVRCRELRV
jgi:hypothetical protein